MNQPLDRHRADALVDAAANAPPHDEDAYELMALPPSWDEAIFEAARTRRDRAWGREITWSPKVFLPLTTLCRDRCSYCSFRRSPGEPGAHTMTADEVRHSCRQARDAGCVEALMCLGDRPEAGFAPYRRHLAERGLADTCALIEEASSIALEEGLLPHTNAGVLRRDELARLRATNVSMGLMLESVSERLCAPGMPHHRAPDKRPAVRLAMTRDAGDLRIPFTSGVLVGIGERPDERVATLLAIRDLHRAWGHVQEVIVQNFRAGSATPMARAPEPATRELARCIAVARLVLDDDVSVQTPPNLNAGRMTPLLDAGINDVGGISPVTPDFVNPAHPWPHVSALAATCDGAGYRLVRRLPVYDRYLRSPGWVDEALTPHIVAARQRVAIEEAA